jgi:hypothetical protein
MPKCSACDAAPRETDRFCSNCGTAFANARVRSPRSGSNRLRGAILLSVLAACAFWAAYSYYQREGDRERFARNIRCSEVARNFAKSRSDDGAGATVLYGFFSPKRNSCVTALERRFSDRFIVQVADPVTGEVMWVEGCSLPDECNESLISTMRIDVKDAIARWSDRPLDRPVMPPPR